MSSSMTGLEREALAELRLEMNRLLALAADQVREELDELASHRPLAGGAVARLQRDTASLIRDCLISRGLRELNLCAQYDRLVADHNGLIDRIKDRDRAAALRAQNERERSEIRSQACPQCFTIHKGDCA